MSDVEAQTLMQTGIAALALIGYAWKGIEGAIAALLIVFVAGVSTTLLTHNNDTDR